MSETVRGSRVEAETAAYALKNLGRAEMKVDADSTYTSAKGLNKESGERLLKQAEVKAMVEAEVAKERNRLLGSFRKGALEDEDFGYDGILAPSPVSSPTRKKAKESSIVDIACSDEDSDGDGDTFINGVLNYHPFGGNGGSNNAI